MYEGSFTLLAKHIFKKHDTYNCLRCLACAFADPWQNPIRKLEMRTGVISALQLFNSSVTNFLTTLNPINDEV